MKSTLLFAGLVAVVIAGAGLAFRPAPKEKPKMPAIQIYDEDGHAAAPVKRSMPLPAQMQVGAVPVAEDAPMPAKLPEITSDNRLPVAIHPAEWTVVSSGAAPETVTRAGEEGKRHYITGLWVTLYPDAAGVATATLTDGATTIWQGSVAQAGTTIPGHMFVEFVAPLRCTAGAAAALAVTQGPGATVDVVLAGYTR